MTSANERLRVGGIVVCGGQSTRMGRPKAWLPVGDELMLPRIVRILSEVVQPVIVVAAPGQDLPTVAGDVVIVRDARPGRGPLEGLAAGLRALPMHSDAAFVSSCDAPLLQPAFIRRMIDLLGGDRMAVPILEGRHYPLTAVYGIDVLPAVEWMLDHDRLRMTGLLDGDGVRVVLADELRDVDPGLQSLRNVNTPEDYAIAVHLAACGLAEPSERRDP